MTAHDAASGQSIFELTASDLEDLPQELLKELRLRHKKRAARNRRAQVEPATCKHDLQVDPELQAALGGEGNHE